MRQPAALTKEARDSRIPPAPPAPPPGRVVREGVAPPLSIVIIGCVLAAAALIAVKLFVPASVQTSARLQCEAPPELETRLVYLNARADGSIDVACGPSVGGSNSGARRR